MNVTTAMLAGAGIGACAMYALDPETGRRRRAVARDKMTRLQRKATEAAGVTARDIKNRAQGLVAEGRSLVSEGTVNDKVLSERVRSKLGFLVRHPSAIQVDVVQGRVILQGPVLADEVEQLLKGVAAVRQVRGIENHLEVHQRPGEVPGLQGDPKPKPTGEPMDILQNRWSPATRFLLGSGATLLLYSAGRPRSAVVTFPALFVFSMLASTFARKRAESSRRRHKAVPKSQSDADVEFTPAWST